MIGSPCSAGFSFGLRPFGLAGSASGYGLTHGHIPVLTVLEGAMLKRHTAIVFGFCIAATACSEGPAGGIASPQLLPSLSASTSTDLDLLAHRTVDDAGILEAAGAQQAATGGRASGHADGPTFGGFARDEYSFIALSTAPTISAPFAAKGEFEGHFVDPEMEVRIHANVTCLAIVGNQAWISGPIERFIENGQPIEPPPFREFLVRVADVGEGASKPDLMGAILFRAFPQSCQNRNPALVLSPSEMGNLQVVED
jgi:hypothetical protein